MTVLDFVTEKETSGMDYFTMYMSAEELIEIEAGMEYIATHCSMEELYTLLGTSKQLLRIRQADIQKILAKYLRTETWLPDYSARKTEFDSPEEAYKNISDGEILMTVSDDRTALLFANDITPLEANLVLSKFISYTLFDCKDGKWVQPGPYVTNEAAQKTYNYTMEGMLFQIAFVKNQPCERFFVIVTTSKCPESVDKIITSVSDNRNSCFEKLEVLTTKNQYRNENIGTYYCALIDSSNLEEYTVCVNDVEYSFDLGQI